jgi:hypothetical protein
MARGTDWGTLTISIVVGVGVGFLVAIGSVAVGMPTYAVAPITGGAVAALVPSIHRLTARGQDA